MSACSSLAIVGIPQDLTLSLLDPFLPLGGLLVIVNCVWSATEAGLGTAAHNLKETMHDELKQNFPYWVYSYIITSYFIIFH